MTLKLEVGKMYINDASVNKFKVVGLDGDSVWYRVIRPDGSFQHHSCFTKALNNWKEYKEPEYKWFNIYKEYVGASRFTSKDSADAQAIISAERCHRIACVRLDMDTGECVNEPI